EEIKSSSSGEVITNVVATAARGSPFDGNVDEIYDLADLLEAAWGNEDLGLHRGHAPIENVLEAFLGISHKEMHVLMEQEGLNLDGVCQHLGLNTQNLVESLVNSFRPFVEQGVNNGVIGEAEADGWLEQLRTQFSKRVYWKG
ncbi:MAG: hypothetical protein MI754_18075, partial [Chromatiales bacterium]|nr:hypothetical protein [Chromatiales bacterium]